MIINSMEHFQQVCRNAFVDLYNIYREPEISYEDTFVVWSCKALQNWKCIVCNKVDNILAEYTFNGDKGELYEDVYKKLSNRCITE